MLEGFRRYALSRLGPAHKSEYEFKRYEVKRLEGTPFFTVTAEVGRVNDEGTMAEVVGRDRYDFFVGPRGGVTYYPLSGSGSKRMRPGHWWDIRRS